MAVTPRSSQEGRDATESGLSADFTLFCIEAGSDLAAFEVALLELPGALRGGGMTAEQVGECVVGRRIRWRFLIPCGFQAEKQIGHGGRRQLRLAHQDPREAVRLCLMVAPIGHSGQK